MEDIDELKAEGILTFLKLDVPAIVAGLLHDTLEDTVATRAELEKEFGSDVARLVEGVTKIGQIPFKTDEEKQAENFRKMVLSMADDIRVVFIKLADRLHNMQTLEALSDEKRKKIAQETMEIYAPLANRLGMSWIKQQLEDLCFQYLEPDAWSHLKLRLAKDLVRLTSKDILIMDEAGMTDLHDMAYLVDAVKFRVSRCDLDRCAHRVTIRSFGLETVPRHRVPAVSDGTPGNPCEVA